MDCKFGINVGEGMDVSNDFEGEFGGGKITSAIVHSIYEEINLLKETKNEMEGKELFGVKVKEPKYYYKRYAQEVFEAFISVMLIRYAMGKDIPMVPLVKASFVIGLVTLLLEEYNPSFKENIVQGITLSVGSNLIGKFS